MSREAPTDTIAALSSGRPPAAIAIIRTSGPRVLAVLRALGGRQPEPRRASLVRLRDPADGSPLDDALVLYFPGPNSATGEDIVEYQCHGGSAVVDRLLAAITALDEVRLAQPGEFTRRALMNGRLDLTEAEGLADLLESETESQRRAALLMAEGGLRRLVENWRERLVALSARAEASIDYVNDEDETTSDAAILARDASNFRAELSDWLERPRAEALKEGVRVALAGPPNAGKSSLLNALVGYERAIVTDVPGTTRDSIEVPVAVDGIAFQLIDTAGLRDTSDMVELAGIERTRRETQRADILLWLGEPDKAPAHPRLVRLQSRCDLPGREVALPGILAVSAVTGANLSDLWLVLTRHARELLPVDGVVALNARQARLIEEACSALAGVRQDDVVLTAEALRNAAHTFDRLTGRAGIEDMLDALFGRFCLGK